MATSSLCIAIIFVHIHKYLRQPSVTIQLTKSTNTCLVLIFDTTQLGCFAICLSAEKLGGGAVENWGLPPGPSLEQRLFANRIIVFKWNVLPDSCMECIT